MLAWGIEGLSHRGVARFESQRRSERIMAGLARRKTEGKPVGGQPGRTDKKPRKRGLRRRVGGWR